MTNLHSNEKVFMAYPISFARPEDANEHTTLIPHESQILAAQTFVQSEKYARMAWNSDIGHMTISEPNGKRPNRLESLLVVSPCGSGKTLIITFVVTLIRAYVKNRGTRVLILTRNCRDAQAMLSGHPTGLTSTRIHPDVQVVGPGWQGRIDQTRPVIAVVSFQSLPLNRHNAQNVSPKPSGEIDTLFHLLHTFAGKWDAMLIDEAHQLGVCTPVNPQDGADSTSKCPNTQGNEMPNADGATNNRMEGVSIQIHGWPRAKGTQRRECDSLTPTMLLTGSPFRHGHENRMADVAAALGIDAEHILQTHHCFPPLYAHEDTERRLHLENARMQCVQSGQNTSTANTLKNEGDVLRFRAILAREVASCEDCTHRLSFSPGWSGGRCVGLPKGRRAYNSISPIIESVVKCPVRLVDVQNVNMAVPVNEQLTHSATYMATLLPTSVFDAIINEIWSELERSTREPLTFDTYTRYTDFYNVIGTIGDIIADEVRATPCHPDDARYGGSPIPLRMASEAAYRFQHHIHLGPVQIRQIIVAHTSLCASRQIAVYLGHVFGLDIGSPLRDSSGCQQVEYLNGQGEHGDVWFDKVVRTFGSVSQTDMVNGTIPMTTEYILREAINTHPELRARTIAKLRARGAALRYKSSNEAPGMTLQAMREYVQVFGGTKAVYQVQSQMAKDVRVREMLNSENVTPSNILECLLRVASSDPQSADMTSADLNTYLFFTGHTALQASQEADLLWKVAHALETTPSSPQVRILVGTDVLDEAIDTRTTLLISVGGMGPSVTQEIQRRGRVQRPQYAPSYRVVPIDGRVDAHPGALGHRMVPSFATMGGAAHAVDALSRDWGMPVYHLDVRLCAPQSRVTYLINSMDPKMYNIAATEPSRQRPVPNDQNRVEAVLSDGQLRIHGMCTRISTAASRVETRLAAMRQWSHVDAPSHVTMNRSGWGKRVAQWFTDDTRTKPGKESPGVYTFRRVLASTKGAISAIREMQRGYIWAAQKAQRVRPFDTMESQPTPETMLRMFQSNVPARTYAAVIRYITRRGSWRGVSCWDLLSSVPNTSDGGVDARTEAVTRNRRDGADASSCAVGAEPPGIASCSTLADVRRYVKHIILRRPIAIDRVGSPFDADTVAREHRWIYDVSRGLTQNVVVRIDPDTPLNSPGVFLVTTMSYLTRHIAPVWLGRAVVNVDGGYAAKESFVYEIRGVDGAVYREVNGVDLTTARVRGGRLLGPATKKLWRLLFRLTTGGLPFKLQTASMICGMHIRTLSGRSAGIIVRSTCRQRSLEVVVESQTARPFQVNDNIITDETTGVEMIISESSPHIPDDREVYWCGHHAHLHIPQKKDEVVFRVGEVERSGHVLHRRMTNGFPGVLRALLYQGDEWANVCEHNHPQTPWTVCGAAACFTFPQSKAQQVHHTPTRVVYIRSSSDAATVDHSRARAMLAMHGGRLELRVFFCNGTEEIIPVLNGVDLHTTITAAFQLADALYTAKSAYITSVTIALARASEVYTDPCLVVNTTSVFTSGRSHVTYTRDVDLNASSRSDNFQNPSLLARQVIMSIPILHTSPDISNAALMRTLLQLDLTKPVQFDSRDEREITRAVLVDSIGGAEIIDRTCILAKPGEKRHVRDSGNSGGPLSRKNMPGKRRVKPCDMDDIPQRSRRKLIADDTAMAAREYLYASRMGPNALEQKYAVLPGT